MNEMGNADTLERETKTAPKKKSAKSDAADETGLFRQMVDNIDAFGTALDDPCIGHAADYHLGAPVAQLLRLDAFFVIERHYLMAVVEQPFDQRLAGKPCAAGNQDPHRCQVSKAQAP